MSEQKLSHCSAQRSEEDAEEVEDVEEQTDDRCSEHT